MLSRLLSCHRQRQCISAYHAGVSRFCHSLQCAEQPSPLQSNLIAWCKLASPQRKVLRATMCCVAITAFSTMHTHAQWPAALFLGQQSEQLQAPSVAPASEAMMRWCDVTASSIICTPVGSSSRDLRCRSMASPQAWARASGSEGGLPPCSAMREACRQAEEPESPSARLTTLLAGAHYHSRGTALQCTSSS